MSAKNYHLQDVHQSQHEGTETLSLLSRFNTRVSEGTDQIDELRKRSYWMLIRQEGFAQDGASGASFETVSEFLLLLISRQQCVNSHASSTNSTNSRNDRATATHHKNPTLIPNYSCASLRSRGRLRDIMKSRHSCHSRSNVPASQSNLKQTSF